MELDSDERKILGELSKKGYCGNWYKPFGRPKLLVYKDVSTDDRIVLSCKGPELEIAAYFVGINFLDYEEKERRIRSFEEAIKIFEEVFSAKYVWPTRDEE
jgi:hypothetical protein